MFRFIKHPEFIQVGSRLVFRDGTTKGLGVVTDIFPLDAPTTSGRSFPLFVADKISVAP